MFPLSGAAREVRKRSERLERPFTQGFGAASMDNVTTQEPQRANLSEYTQEELLCQDRILAPCRIALYHVAIFHVAIYRVPIYSIAPYRRLTGYYPHEIHPALSGTKIQQFPL